MAGLTPRDQVKRAALRLFARHGVDGVTVRRIAEACGQKNHAAVGYYFGSKDALVRELVTDGARVIDERRNAMLDRLEAGGRRPRIADIAAALVEPSIGLAAAGEEEAYIRFIQMLMLNRRDLFMDALEGRWNSGYLRCLDHLRRLLPKLSPAMQNQRFVFIGAYLAGVLALREAALGDRSRPHRLWDAPETLADIIRTLTAILDAPAGDGPGAEAEATAAVVGSVGVILS
ncbi:TetR/AcrR family transcriptional regulator [Zavarzinia compransoris]|uniref:TetR/AcrR family transcriptional regulator n=1 Tax=Zavarzinia compransoris TaxID=1264899 RepID=A0A317E0I8_9PROT|nr:TetR/AcrR family transcriptional regulator [Zavarzinia compransoris]PWR18873.1 TetR/AcrR family transcriptional regulator [Zavarzinia compransoris]TDP48868.1 TetR family transcriptional regulator [Zavarzinia compransoris]